MAFEQEYNASMALIQAFEKIVTLRFVNVVCKNY